MQALALPPFLGVLLLVLSVSSMSDPATVDLHYSPNRTLVGDFIPERALLDADYHPPVTAARQTIQDAILRARLFPPDAGATRCRRALHARAVQWVVFMAGAMGAGKTHARHALAAAHLFPAAAFTVVDVDGLRVQLPEWSAWQRDSPLTAGRRTQKEAGALAELLTHAALRRGRHVLVDGYPMLVLPPPPATHACRGWC